MPSPFKGTVKVNPILLRDKPELACYVAVVCAHWTEIENELMTIYAIALHTAPPLAAMALNRVNSLPARLDMIMDAIAFSVSLDAAEQFGAMLKEIRKCAGLRSDLVHCIWAVHPDLPDSLIWFRGLGDPELTMQEYRQRDFAEIVLRLAKLQLSLRQFLQSLPDEIERKAPTRVAWQLTPPEQDQKT